MMIIAQLIRMFLLLFYNIMSFFSLVIVLELLMFMVEHHTYHIKNYILHRNALKRALLLIHSKHTSLSLSSLRLLRKIIGKTDESYNNVIVKVKRLILGHLLYIILSVISLLNWLKLFSKMGDDTISSIVLFLNVSNISKTRI